MAEKPVVVVNRGGGGERGANGVVRSDRRTKIRSGTTSTLPIIMTLAQQEKADYYARVVVDIEGEKSQSRPSPAPPSPLDLRRTNRPGALDLDLATSRSNNRVVPPTTTWQQQSPSPTVQAAFARARRYDGDSPLNSPRSQQNAKEFGDFVLNALGSDDQKRRTVDRKSEWLASKLGTSRKWFWIGWTCSISIVVAIVVGIVVGIERHFDGDDGAPTVLNLGGSHYFLGNAGVSDEPSDDARARPSHDDSDVERDDPGIVSGHDGYNDDDEHGVVVVDAERTTDRIKGKRFLNHASFVALKASFWNEPFAKRNGAVGGEVRAEHFPCDS
ncbi:hypothetical protein JCM3766R1_000686 [Sporobolomyces carnicolor]